MASSTAEAYNLRLTDNGSIVRWQRDEIVMELDSSLELLGPAPQVTARIEESLAAWEESEVLPRTFAANPHAGGGGGYEPDRDSRNIVMALDGEWPFAAAHTAVTITTYSSDSGQLLDTDVIFDANRRWHTSNATNHRFVDLLDTATHEMGHVLGLDHSTLTEATMYAESTLGSVRRRSLHTDDINALLAAYSDAPQLAPLPLPGCQVAPTSSSSQGLWWAWLLALAWLGRQRRRRQL
jgi:MYXO-CTERM domain-containing protein